MISWFLAHGLQVVGGVSSVLTGAISICLLIPGDQPEKFLQSIVDFLSGFSKK